MMRLSWSLLSSLFVFGPIVTCLSPSDVGSSSRRKWLTSTVSGVLVTPLIANAADELPSFLRPYTALAPLGAPKSSAKTLNLSLDKIAERLSNDLTNGATNQGGYFLTGDLSTDLFRDDCVFVDPTNSVSSLSRYQQALRILFDPAQSRVDLVKPLVVNQDDGTITAKIRSRGVLQLPWHPRVSAYESNITYKIDSDGLISEQSQTWSKSASDALRESFTPNLFGSPTTSTLIAETDEPPEVTRLFDYINGRRPNEYTQEERFEVANLIDKVVEQHHEWKRDLLPGKWLLAYLQPGPEGADIDQRIPFPEFDFNDNYQVFTPSSVTNIGELFGPLLQVRVSGALNEDNPTSLAVPKRFIANINDGKLCGKDADACIPLPISGEGLFDGVYLGKRVRIGQNINGGGARVVQVRVA